MALYVWGVCSVRSIRDGQVGVLARAVEMTWKHGLPVGVGSHSLQVPIHCEKAGVACVFYVREQNRFAVGQRLRPWYFRASTSPPEPAL